MTANAPVPDVKNKTVTHEGRTFTMRPLTEDSYTVIENGVALGRVVYSFGANAVVESPAITEEALYAVSEVWFAALEEAGPQEEAAPADGEADS